MIVREINVHINWLWCGMHQQSPRCTTSTDKSTNCTMNVSSNVLYPFTILLALSMCVYTDVNVCVCLELCKTCVESFGLPVLVLAQRRRSEGDGAHFHLNERNGILFAFPCFPYDSLLIVSCVIEPVEVGLVAVPVPPTPSVGHGTEADVGAVPVSGGEVAAIVVCHGVTCCASITRHLECVQLCWTNGE